jgi:hypothetical protein
MVDDVLPENLVPAPEGTIFDRLDAHRIPWRNYYSSFPPTGYVFLGDAIRDHASVVPIAQFFTDAKSGKLPGFTIIDPDFGHSSGENPQTSCTPRSSPPQLSRPSWSRRRGRARCWCGPR